MKHSGLPSRLKQARAAKKLSWRTASAKLDWSVGRLQSYEKGKTAPTVEELLLLAAAYGCDAEWLLFGRLPTPSAAGAIELDNGGGETIQVPCDLGVELSELRAVRLTTGFVGKASAGDIAIYRKGAIDVGFVVVTADRGVSGVMETVQGASAWLARSEPAGRWGALKERSVAGLLIALIRFEVL